MSGVFKLKTSDGAEFCARLEHLLGQTPNMDRQQIHQALLLLQKQYLTGLWSWSLSTTKRVEDLQLQIQTKLRGKKK
jgi:hypothetical protein